jgi:hypothetical protein
MDVLMADVPSAYFRSDEQVRIKVQVLVHLAFHAAVQLE